MAADRRGPARFAAALLALATLFFVIGAISERNGHADANALEAALSTSSVYPATQTLGHVEGGDEGAEGTTDSTSAEATGEYHPLGINIERPAFIAIGAAASLAAALALALRTRRATFAIVALLGAYFAIVEVAEVAHQADVSKWGLLILAALALGLHAATVVVAAPAFCRQPS